jgi:hypothetical protein
MKNARLATIVILTLFIVSSFNKFTAGSIKGTVNPPDGAIRAWAISATDSLRSVVNEGVFVIPDAKPGNYNILIEAKPPYKNAVRDNILVNEGVATDLGEIKLER